jgi:hypothetical protein
VQERQRKGHDWDDGGGRGGGKKYTKKEMKITQGKDFKDMEWLI